MSLKQTLKIISVLERADANADMIKELFKAYKDVSIESSCIKGAKGQTDFIKITIAGKKGKSKGGSAPTLGVIGRLGGIGARPGYLGLVSDADGAIAALSTALVLANMQSFGDILDGDVIISTHICPNAPTLPHEPVDFMDAPVDMGVMNEYEVDQSCDAILSIDTTKGNKLLNHLGFALSPTVKEGVILPVSDDLLNIMAITTGEYPVTFPLCMADITPYGNDLYHINSILQPSCVTFAAVVGVALCTKSVVPGCASGAYHEIHIASAAKFCVEVAKYYGAGKCAFYKEHEYKHFVKLYGSMRALQKGGA